MKIVFGHHIYHKYKNIKVKKLKDWNPINKKYTVLFHIKIIFIEKYMFNLLKISKQDVSLVSKS